MCLIYFTSFREGTINDESAGEAAEAREADCPSDGCRDLRPFCESTFSLDKEHIMLRKDINNTRVS